VDNASFLVGCNLRLDNFKAAYRLTIIRQTNALTFAFVLGVFVLMVNCINRVSTSHGEIYAIMCSVCFKLTFILFSCTKIIKLAKTRL